MYRMDSQETAPLGEICASGSTESGNTTITAVTATTEGQLAGNDHAEEAQVTLSTAAYEAMLASLEELQVNVEKHKAEIQSLVAGKHATQRKLGLAQSKLNNQLPVLDARITHVQRQVADATAAYQNRQRGEDDGLRDAAVAANILDVRKVEMDRLREHIKGQQAEIEMWKAEAMGQGKVAVSQGWQESVDEAVCRERQKDVIVIEALCNEIAKLKANCTCQKETS